MSQTITRRLTTLTAAGIIAGAAALGIASPAFAHDELVGTDLIANETNGTLESIQLSFSNSIIEVGTEIIVTSADGESVKEGAPIVAGPDVTQPLKKDLAEGQYSFAWRVVSSDGHPIDGAFDFTVKADGSADKADIAVPEDDPRVATENEDHDHADGEDHGDTNEDSGLPTGAIIAISIGGVAVLAAVIATVIIGQRRRAQAFGSAADASESATNNDSTDGTEDAR